LTLLFFDGFETYASTDTMATGLDDVYDLESRVTSTEVSVATSDRITGGQCMKVSIQNSSDDDDYPTIGPQLALSSFSSHNEWVFGVALKIDDLTTAYDSMRPIFELYDSDSLRIVTLMYTDDGDLTVNRITNGTNVNTVLDTALGAITAGDWQYVEWKIKIDDVLGSWEVRVDEVTVMSGNADTDAIGGVTRPSQLRFGHINAQNVYYDDLYILDTLGTINKDFLGDIRVQRLRPNGATATTNFSTLVGAATNWEAINELGEDDDTSYIESNTVANRDLYEYEDLPSAPDTIYGVIAKPVLRKSDAGSRTYKLICSSGISEDETGTLYPGSTFVRQAQIFETDPFTGVFWTEAGVNNAKFGVEIVS